MDLASRYRWIAAHILPHEAELRGWLRRRLGSLGQNDVDDLVQEAYSRIWAADFASIRNGRAYLFTTVRNLLAEYARRRQIVPIELLGEIDSLNISSGEPGPDRQVAARQELTRLRSIVATLPGQCRRVFELRKFEGLSHRDVAQRMGLSEKTVENHLTRALARIGDLLAAPQPGADSASLNGLRTYANDEDRDTISDTAARWVIRNDAGPLSTEEARELDAWLGADPRHRGAYTRARAQWGDLDRLATLNGPVVSIEATLSAALLDGASRAGGRPLFASGRISRRLMLAGSLASAAVIGGGWAALRDTRAHYESSIGEVRRITLADGSTMLLNTNSEVTVQMGKNIRDIRLLRGEAMFEVAHDEAKPFVVSANRTAVRAVGTAFAVRLEATQVDITVTEGIVEVADVRTIAGSSMSLPSQPGVRRVRAQERMLVTGTATPVVKVFPTEPASTERRLAWREGMLAFDGESLADAVAEINRHNHHRIVIDDPILGRRSVVGVFRTSDLEGFAAAAAAALQARAVPDGDVIRLEPTALPPR